jgi:hypothetical protein
MSKRRWPVRVETRRSPSRKREQRTTPQVVVMADRVVKNAVCVVKNEPQATTMALTDKNEPTTSPRPGALADDVSRMLRGSQGRFPKDLWSDWSA